MLIHLDADGTEGTIMGHSSCHTPGHSVSPGEMACELTHEYPQLVMSPGLTVAQPTRTAAGTNRVRLACSTVRG